MIYHMDVTTYLNYRVSMTSPTCTTAATLKML